jgi:hypothetical protein
MSPNPSHPNRPLLKLLVTASNLFENIYIYIIYFQVRVDMGLVSGNRI